MDKTKILGPTKTLGLTKLLGLTNIMGQKKYRVKKMRFRTSKTYLSGRWVIAGNDTT